MAKNADVADRIEILEVEQSVATNVLEWSGWPVQELSREQEQENRRRALAGLDAVIEDQMSELEALRQVAATMQHQATHKNGRSGRES